MAMHRAQLLLEPELYHRLKEIARRERRSISDVARNFIREGMRTSENLPDEKLQLELAALDRLNQIRDEIREQHGVYTGDLVNEVREERIRQMEEVERQWKERTERHKKS